MNKKERLKALEKRIDEEIKLQLEMGIKTPIIDMTPEEIKLYQGFE